MRKSKIKEKLDKEDEKEIQLNKSDKKLFKEKNKGVRAIANAVFTEYSEVEEQNPGPDH